MSVTPRTTTYRSLYPAATDDGQRADDGPSYLTILIVSHLGAPLLMASYMAWRPSAVTLLLAFGLGAVVLSLAMLPVIKGGMVGLQWARRMHGFGLPAAPVAAAAP